MKHMLILALINLLAQAPPCVPADPARPCLAFPDVRVSSNGWWLCKDTMTFKMDCSAQPGTPGPPTNLSAVMK